MAGLIGREEQINQLDNLLKRAIQGRLQIIFVTGEAGVGKTALVTAFIKQAKREISDLFVASSKCYSVAGGQQEAYLPFVQILEIISTGNERNAIWNRFRQGITELAPDWVQILPGGSIAAAVIRTAQWGQREFGAQGKGVDAERRMVQYTNVLRLAAEAVPLLLWIDDLHWSDNATLDMISFLADHASGSRIMLVSAYRPTDIIHEVDGRPHPVARLANKLKRYEQCNELMVPALTRTDLEQFLVTRRHYFSDAFIERIWRHSGGNPLFIREYVALLHARKLLDREPYGGYVLSQTDVEIEIPTTVQVVIEQRLSLIERDLRQLLSYASVQGERFATRVLIELLDAPEMDILEKLNLLDRVHKLIKELEARHLIIKVGTEYQFIHVLTQQVIYNDLSIGQRRRLHLGIAQLLENLYGNDASKFATDLAIHFEKGGDTASAIYYNLQVSQNSLRVFALDDALIHAQNAQRLIQQVVDEPKSVAWQIEAIIRIVETRYWKAEHKSALEMCDQGEKLCKKQSDFTEQHAYLLYWRSTILFEMGKFEDAVKVVKQAIRMLSSEPLRPRLQGYLYSRLGALYYVLPLQEVQQALDAALVIAEKHGLSDVKVKTLLQKAWVTFDRMGTPEETLLLCQEAIRIADENGMIPEQVICHELIAHANRRLKRGKEAFLHNQQAVMIARQGGLPNALHNALHGLALSWREVREDWQESLELLREALAIADDYHFHPSRFVIGRWFEVTFGLGMWSEAKRASDLLFKEHGDYFRVRGFYHKWRGHMLYASGRFEEAAKSYQEAIKIFKENSLVDEDESDFRSIQPNLGLALLEAGNLEEGIRYLEDASDYWEKRNDTRFTRSLRGLARASFLQEDFIQSLAYLHKALEITEGSYSDRAWPDWPQVCTDLAKVLLVTGNSDEALKHAIVSYKKYKKWGHFLLGEVAFIIGQILVYQDKQQDALPYLQEAQNEWRRINLTHYLPAWKNFMQEHDLI